MHVGIPKEVKDSEYRVAATPEGVRELMRAGHRVVVEASAGLGSAIADEHYEVAGAEIVADADAVFAEAELIVKVKEPRPEEYERFRPGQVLFTYLHLAADERLTRFLAERNVTSVAYETVQTGDGRLPLLAPMSEIAGRMAPQEGAAFLERPRGGRGVLMGGASGVAPARVVVLGAGMAGANAAQIAAGMEAEVTVVDRNVDRLRDIDRVWHGRIQTVMSSALAVERLVVGADMVIGAVLVPGARAPHLVTAETVSAMQPGAVLVDISIDQGGCFETSHVTTHSDPTYVVDERRALLRREHAGGRAAHVDVRPHERHAALRRRDRGPRDRRGGACGPGPRPRGERRRGNDHERWGRGRSRPRRGADRAAHRRRGRLGDPGGGPGRAMTTSIETEVVRYLDHLTVERGLSEHTIAAYRRDLARYAGFLASRDVLEPAEVDEAIVRSFLASISA